MAEALKERPVASVAAPVGFRRFHHVAFLVKDQAATRHFYEDVIGLPLVATWAEVGEFPEFPGRPLEYCHTFFGLDNGAALAFFAFVDDDVYKAYFRGQSPFVHPAVNVSAEFQAGVRARVEGSEWPNFFIDHGYCQSFYVRDPDGLVFEMTVDPGNAGDIAAWQAKTARETLDRWIAGDHRPNNDLREHHLFETK